jgi:threonine dehydrogenase-like Zn-dependent dehydrogenase
MKALVYHGPGRKAWEKKPRPLITKPTDAVVRIVTTTICGTDLHHFRLDDVMGAYDTFANAAKEKCAEGHPGGSLKVHGMLNRGT